LIIAVFNHLVGADEIRRIACKSKSHPIRLDSNGGTTI
jgi:hypothetical protein